MEVPEVLDFRYVAQPVEDFLFPWEGAGSAKNPITMDEDEGFSERMTAPQQSPAMKHPPTRHSRHTSSLIEYFCK